jgi:hypothetical protein
VVAQQPSKSKLECEDLSVLNGGLGCLPPKSGRVNWWVGSLRGSREFRSPFGTRSDTAGDLPTLGKSLILQPIIPKLAENAEKTPKSALGLSALAVNSWTISARSKSKTSLKGMRTGNSLLNSLYQNNALCTVAIWLLEPHGPWARQLFFDEPVWPVSGGQEVYHFGRQALINSAALGRRLTWRQ